MRVPKKEYLVELPEVGIELEQTCKVAKRSQLVCISPDSLPLVKKRGVEVRGGKAPSLKSLPHHA